MTDLRTPGLHHVSTVVGDPATNVAFYTATLGLRLVKRTVNFDDPFAYHLYYGDGVGTPGTLVTCFPTPGGDPGRVGRTQPTATAFAVPRASTDYWQDRLDAAGVAVERVDRFSDPVLRFSDPDGVPLELVGVADADLPAGTVPWTRGPVPAEHAIRGLHGVTLDTAAVYRTAAVLQTLGYAVADETDDRVRYRAPGDRAAVVDLVTSEATRPFGRHGVGTIHHVAVRSPADGDLSAWVDRLLAADLDPTYVTDRHYFRSVYAREPGGVLLEVAGDDPGVTVDEAPDELGSALRLPPRLAAERPEIEAQLPPL